MDSSQLSILATTVLAVQCCIAAYWDFRYRRLPNVLTIAVLVTGLASGLILHDLGWVGMSLAHAALALIVGIALFAGGMIGGGDAKFYAAVAAWLPLPYGIVMLGLVSLCGLVLAIAWFPLRAQIAAMAPDESAAREFRKVPYGLAIAAGGLLSHLVSTGLWSGLS